MTRTLLDPLGHDTDPRITEALWESQPTEFFLACTAWCAAAKSAASPLYPPELERLAVLYRFEEPTLCQLGDLDAEAYRRAEWLPHGQEHPVRPRGPILWEHHAQYGLTWQSSVDTILARTAAGWVVRIVGGHALRQSAAERVLGAGLVRVAA